MKMKKQPQFQDFVVVFINYDLNINYLAHLMNAL